MLPYKPKKPIILTTGVQRLILIVAAEDVPGVEAVDLVPDRVDAEGVEQEDRGQVAELVADQWGE